MPSVSSTTRRQPPSHLAPASRPWRCMRSATRRVRDVLSAGLLLHRLLCGQPALDEPDVGRTGDAPAAARPRTWCACRGTSPLAVPEALRAIANRATDRQERQRYRSARGLMRALEGWLQAEGAAGGGPLALLIDRLHSVGVAAVVARQRRARRAPGADGSRAHQRTGRGGAAGPGSVLRTAALGEQRTGARCPGRRQRARC